MPRKEVDSAGPGLPRQALSIAKLKVGGLAVSEMAGSATVRLHEPLSATLLSPVTKTGRSGKGGGDEARTDAYRIDEDDMPLKLIDRAIEEEEGPELFAKT